MSDMLVKLYELQNDWAFLSEQNDYGIIIRKPIGPEKYIIVDWIRKNFNDAWASEAEISFSNRPMSIFVAIQEDRILGFSCYDATALGLFGPIGVEESFRGKGTGRALLLSCMLDMKLKGYAYAVVGYTEDLNFYNKNVGAIEIPDSSPGIYKTWLNPNVS